MSATVNKWIFVPVILFQASLFFILPSFGTSVFLSPDETSHAVAARVFAQRGDMRMKDLILRDVPWLHPRSFVTHGASMVPVGFLGFPMILGSLWLLFGEWGMVFTVPILVISAAYPLWRFMERLGLIPRIVTVMTWLSFPTVILYANRGFFSNLPVVCLTLWAAWCVWSSASQRRLALGGFLFGLAIAVRPIELVWMLPWLWLAWVLRKDRALAHRRACIVFMIAAALPLILVALVAWRTYGSPFVIGYALRDPIRSPTVVEEIKFLPVAPVARWPFGFHPSHVRLNVQSYLFGMWGPWMFVAVAVCVLSLLRRARRSVLAIALWTIAVSIFVYGHAIYQDHVGLNVVSSGNSFLRYLLPFAPIFALTAGTFSANVFETFSRRCATIISVCFVLMLVSLGIASAFLGDDESLLPAARELRQYHTLRRATIERLGTQTIILSDRSDKIFFPTFRVTSPLPPMPQIQELVRTAPVPVALLSTTLDDRGMALWHDAGIDLQPALSHRHQTLYTLTPARAARIP